MEGELVFGSKISVKHLNKEKENTVVKNFGMFIYWHAILLKLIVIPIVKLYYTMIHNIAGNITIRSRAVSESEIVSGNNQSGSKQMYATSASVLGTRTLPIPHYQSSSSVVGVYPPALNAHCTVNAPPTGLVCQILSYVRLSIFFDFFIQMMENPRTSSGVASRFLSLLDSSNETIFDLI